MGASHCMIRPQLRQVDPKHRMVRFIGFSWAKTHGDPVHFFVLPNVGLTLNKQIAGWWFVTWMDYFPQELGWWSNLTNSIIFQGGRYTGIPPIRLGFTRNVWRSHGQDVTKSSWHRPPWNLPSSSSILQSVPHGRSRARKTWLGIDASTSQ